MSTINVITGLSGTLAKADWNFATSRAVELNYDLKPIIRGIQLGKDGIVFYRGGLFVGVPMSELWKLAETLEPKFAEPAKKPDPAKQ